MTRAASEAKELRGVVDENRVDQTPAPDPYRCPVCGSVFVGVDGVAVCPRCGFASDDPHAGELWRIDTALARVLAARTEHVAALRGLDAEADRLARERERVVLSVGVAGGRRPARAGAARRAALARAAVQPPSHDVRAVEAGQGAGPSAPRGKAAPQAGRRRRRPAPSAQVLIAGLGALLLVVAGIVFAAVTWQRLGAAGQAAVLAGATALAAGLAVVASRHRLMATAEALGVVTAGFALVDVHGVRLAVDPDGDGRFVWALGLIVVSGALLALGRASRTRSPGVVAAMTIQLPMVLLADVVTGSVVAVAAALLFVAQLDYAIARRQLDAAGGRRLDDAAGRRLDDAAGGRRLDDAAGGRRLDDAAVGWLPPPRLVRVLGALTWLLGWATAARIVVLAVDDADRLFAVLVLAGATAQLVALAVLLARRGRASPASAVCVLVAGDAVLLVLGVHLLVATDSGAEVVWAVGLGVAAAGLALLGRATRLSAPLVAAAGFSQLPLLLLAHLVDRSTPGISEAGAPGPVLVTALVVLAWIDFAVAAGLESAVTASGDVPRGSAVVAGRSAPTAGRPGPSPAGPGHGRATKDLVAVALTPEPTDAGLTSWAAGARAPHVTWRWLRALGGLAWALGTLGAMAWAFGAPGAGVSRSVQWWGIGIVAVAAAQALLLARARRPEQALAVVAGVAGVALGFVVVVATTRAVGAGLDVAVLVAAAAAVALTAASVVSRRRRAGEDARVRAAHGAALALAGLSLLPWLPGFVGAVVAPGAALAQQGWWSAPADAEASGVRELLLGPFGDVLRGASPLAAVVVAAGAVVVASDVRITKSAHGSWIRVAAVIVGGYVGLSIAVLTWAIPVWAAMCLFLLGAAALVTRSVLPTPDLRIWYLAAATPFAVSALAWGGLVDVLTVVALVAVAALAGVGAARSVSTSHGSAAAAATAVAGGALAAGAITAGLASGLAVPAAWVLGVVAAAALSGLAVLADGRAPWWAPQVELTAMSLVLAALGALLGADQPDSLSLALAITAVAAAGHVLRPRRREVAAWTGAITGVVLLWLRLGMAEVAAVEPYSLPAAGLLLVAGWRAQRRRPDLGSWSALGPGLLVAAVPSTFVAVTGAGTLRPLLVIVAGAGLAILGAHVRQRAPLVVGVLAAAVVAVDQVFPVVDRLPRWVTLGTAGVVLLVVGATFERRRREARRLYSAYTELR